MDMPRFLDAVSNYVLSYKADDKHRMKYWGNIAQQAFDDKRVEAPPLTEAELNAFYLANSK